MLLVGGCVMDYKLRPYEMFDYEFVYSLKKVVYKKYVEMNWGEWNEIDQRKMFEDFIKSYSKEIFIIIVNNQNVGFFHGGNLENGHYEQRNICILPEFQGNGIGSSILKSIINKHGDQDIYLRCFKQNPVVDLYKRLGFEVYDETDYHFKMVLRRK